MTRPPRNPEKSPIRYLCWQCRAQGIKLWREYGAFAHQPRLLCAPCAGNDQGVNVDTLDETGRILREGKKTDQIGAFVPAVLTDDAQDLWAYTAVPRKSAEKWRALPNRHQS